MTYLKDLIHIPEQVNRGDFVLNLAEGVLNPEQTVANYVVTEQLATAFDDALTFIRSVYDEARPKSKATYLHGSFGSGKSHFMAILSLLLAGHETVRHKERLQPVAVKHDWSRSKKFLLVPLHMIGRASMEQGILGGYSEYIAKQHPEAPLPAFFRATEIIANAQKLRSNMGDDTFFAQLNAGSEAGGGDWGDLETTWDAARFDAAAAHTDPLHEDQRRLVSDIVTHLITSLRNQGDFVDLDHGLVAMSLHAKDLGYDGIVLFLDELVLWLMSRSADPQFVAAQGPKIANLVEGKIANAALPIISFIARQRDLREALGDSLTGSTHKAMSQTMDWWDERFHKITLEDRNLPVIARERLLRPKNHGAKDQIDAAFAATTKVRQDVMDVLLTADSSKEAFRDLYPFSPALVQSLVAVSGQLQRDRTALRILLQMLTSERKTLELGTVVPVGDLWDYIIGENFSANLKAQADTARRLWDEHFCPLLLGEVGLPADADLAELAKDSAHAIPLRNFRMRARIVKTLLLAALVPNVPSLTHLTARKLAALNHGTIQSPIPNQEGRTILTWLRSWAGTVEKLKLTSDPNDPMISIELSDIDTMAIIRDAQGEDNHGNRKRLLQETLYRELGIQLTDTLFHHHRLEWRGCAREFEIRFRNIRLCNAEDLKAPSDKWVMVIDYP
ncbi:MAG: phage resistance protein, partial [Planctomycetota bacterium]